MEKLGYTHFWWVCSFASFAEAGALHLRGLVFGDSCAVGENAVTAWRAFQGLQGLDLAEPSFPDFSKRKPENEVCTAGCVAGDNVTLQPLSEPHVWRVLGGWSLAPQVWQLTVLQLSLLRRTLYLICPFFSKSFEFLRWDCTGPLQLLTLYISIPKYAKSKPKHCHQKNCEMFCLNMLGYA